MLIVCLFVVAFVLRSSDQGAESGFTPFSASGHGRIGVYLTSYAVGKASVWNALLEARERGLVDAVVINVKNMHGEVTYDSAVPLAHTIGSAVDRLDAASVLRELRSLGFYLIARQVLFYDPLLARHLGYSEAWVPVDNEAAVSYNLAIAEEVAGLGFDEIQFDYVRYPDGGVLESIYADRYAAVDRFLAEAQKRLSGRIAISADLFGRVMWGWNEKRIDPIGQSLEAMSAHLDFISPMLYPSHYVEQAYRDDPYRTVSDALEAGRARVDASFRPYLQAFDQALPPGVSLETYISEQVQAAADRGSDGVLFWHPACEYTALYRALD
ncbi:putative glycoside hydrolase [Candidatus Bipolaricaulota bacterium]